jgi:hypothetical protein
MGAEESLALEPVRKDGEAEEPDERPLEVASQGVSVVVDVVAVVVEVVDVTVVSKATSLPMDCCWQLIVTGGYTVTAVLPCLFVNVVPFMVTAEPSSKKPTFVFNMRWLSPTIVGFVRFAVAPLDDVTMVPAG